MIPHMACILSSSSYGMYTKWFLIWHVYKVVPHIACIQSGTSEWRSGKRPRLRARRVKVRFSLRAIILSLENLNVIIRAIN